jgi:hypothetical protein
MTNKLSSTRRTILILVAVFIAIRIIVAVVDYQKKGQATEIQALSSYSIEHILTPDRTRPLEGPLGSEFDVTRSGNILLRAGNDLLEIEPNSDGITVDKATTKSPDSFALDGETLLTLKGRYFGQLEDAGPSEALPLPQEKMRLARSNQNGLVYLFGGPGESAHRAYAIYDDGDMKIIADIPKDVVDVADSDQAIYVAGDHEIYRFDQAGSRLVIRLESGAPPLLRLPSSLTITHSIFPMGILSMS